MYWESADKTIGNLVITMKGANAETQQVRLKPKSPIYADERTGVPKAISTEAKFVNHSSLGREGKGREGKGREGKVLEWNGVEWSGVEGKGRGRKGVFGFLWMLFYLDFRSNVFRTHMKPISDLSSILIPGSTNDDTNAVFPDIKQVSPKL